MMPAIGPLAPAVEPAVHAIASAVQPAVDAVALAVQPAVDAVALAVQRVAVRVRSMRSPLRSSFVASRSLPASAAAAAFASSR